MIVGRAKDGYYMNLESIQSGYWRSTLVDQSGRWASSQLPPAGEGARHLEFSLGTPQRVNDFLLPRAMLGVEIDRLMENRASLVGRDRVKRMLKAVLKNRPGKGVTFGAAFAAQNEIEAGELVARPIEHPMFSSVQARVLIRNGRPRSKASDELLKRILGKLTVFWGRAHASR
jgi:hypothetical protein